MNLNNLLLPFRALRWQYLPLLMVYFANGLAAFSQVAEVFWIKDSLSLSVTEVVAISVWSNFPWTLKILFGQMVDRFKIARSSRHIYIALAAGVMLLGNIVTISIANHFTPITALGSTYHLLIIAGLFIQTGTVLQDLIADTLCYDVVERKDAAGNARSDAEIQTEIGHIQWLGRLFDVGAALLAISISGYLAANFSYAVLSYFIPVVSLVSIIGILVVRKEPFIEKTPLAMPILLGGLLYLSIMVVTGLSKLPYAQEIIFCGGVTIVCGGLYYLCRDLDAQRKREIFGVLVVIFCFRATPEFSPGIEWWQIDVLQFDPMFMGTLKQIGAVLAFIGLWIMAKYIVQRQIFLVLFWINAIQVILYIPLIMMAFGFHEWTLANFGIGPKVIALMDTAAESPFRRLGFLVMCVIAAYYAPKKHVATWFALVGSLMSLSLVSGGRLITKTISNIYVIERGFYDNVANQMVVTALIHFLLPTIAIIAFSKWAPSIVMPKERDRLAV